MCKIKFLSCLYQGFGSLEPFCCGIDVYQPQIEICCNGQRRLRYNSACQHQFIKELMQFTSFSLFFSRGKIIFFFKGMQLQTGIQTKKLFVADFIVLVHWTENFCLCLGQNAQTVSQLACMLHKNPTSKKKKKRATKNLSRRPLTSEYCQCCFLNGRETPVEKSGACRVPMPDFLLFTVSMQV